MLPGITWLLALAVSIDGFSAGFSCGLRKLIIPFSSLLVICFSSMVAITASMLLGEGVKKLVPVQYLTLSGGLLLIALGVYVIVHNLLDSRAAAEKDPGAGDRPILKRMAGLLRKPEEADIDHSGVLSGREALLLGLALAVDAFAAGFGAAMIGSPLFITVLAVGLTKMTLVPLGVLLGNLAARGINFRYASFWGGGILIFVGIMTVIQT